MSQAQTVPALSIALMAVSLCIGLFLPIALFIFLRRRFRARALPLLTGAVVFVVFCLILERLLISTLMAQPQINGFLTSRWWIYSLFGGLMAGLFEETGRLCAFYFILKRRHNSLGGALAYGVGHGGIEAVLLCSLAMAGNITIAVLMNTGGLQAVTGFLPDTAPLTALTTAASADFLAAGIERVIAIAFHLAASALVWMSATGRGPCGLYFLAILMHTVVNFPAGMYQTGIIQNIWLVEALTALLVLAVCAATASIYHKASQNYTPLLQYEPTDFGL